MFNICSSDLADVQIFLSEFAISREDSVKVELTDGVEFRLFDYIELLVVPCHNPGFDADRVRILRDLVRDVASGHIGPCKFVAFDLRASSDGAKPSADFALFVEELSNLIFQAPILSIAWGRGELSGPEPELALACSMVVGEVSARIAFTLDLVDSRRTNSLLAHKIGFVQAERLMESGSVLSAAAAHELMLLHSVVASEPGLDGIKRFAQSRTRRHNSACGLYRAQRIAMARAH